MPENPRSAGDDRRPPQEQPPGAPPGSGGAPVHGAALEAEFRAEVWYWRGPAPFYFVTVPDPQCGELRDAATMVSYGWGMIPVHVHIGDTDWATSLWPHDDRYIVPLKVAVRRAEHIDEGDSVAVRLRLRP